MKTWVNGTILEAAESFVSVFDHGLTVGDGVFETAKVVDGTPFALTRHLRPAAELGARAGAARPRSRPRAPRRRRRAPRERHSRGAAAAHHLHGRRQPARLGPG